MWLPFVSIVLFKTHVSASSFLSRYQAGNPRILDAKSICSSQYYSCHLDDFDLNI